MATSEHTTKTRTIRVSTRSHESLRRWAAEHGCSLVAAVDKLIEEAERERFWEQVNASYTALKADPKAWAEELEERREWEAALMDDLRDDPWEGD